MPNAAALINFTAILKREMHISVFSQIPYFFSLSDFIEDTSVHWIKGNILLKSETFLTPIPILISHMVLSYSTASGLSFLTLLVSLTYSAA